MTDVTLDQSDQGAPEPEVDPDLPVEAPDDAGDSSQDGEDDGELEEIEIEGQKLSVPKSAKEALEKGVLRQADYTKKTQEVAESRRAFEAEKAAQQATFEDRVQVRQIQSHMDSLDEAINQGQQRLQNIDWAALKNLPDGDMRLQQAQIELRTLEHNRSLLAAEKAKLEAGLGEKAKAASLAQQQATAKLVEQRDVALSKDIPGWAKAKPEVEAFAIKHGISKAELDATADPRIFKMLHYAKLGMDAEQRGRRAAANGGEPAIPPVKPATSLTGAGKGLGSSAPTMRDSPEAWMRKRNAELAAKRAPRPQARR